MLQSIQNCVKTRITPKDLVKEAMKKFNASDSQIKDVINLYGKIENRSSMLNRSRPQSVAAGLTYYYILMKHKDITLKDFTKEVNLSELTVTKITKEISKVLHEHHGYDQIVGINLFCFSKTQNILLYQDDKKFLNSSSVIIGIPI